MCVLGKALNMQEKNKYGRALKRAKWELDICQICVLTRREK